MTTPKPNFDIEAAIKALREGSDLTKDGVLPHLIKQLTDAAMQPELDSRLSEESAPNRKIGCTPKKVRSTLGGFEL